MAEQQQKCGKCGAVNSADAVTCVNCGTVLAAYAPVPIDDPADDPSGESTSLHSETAPAASSAPVARSEGPTEKSTDWRDLFEQAPGASEPAFSFDSLPAAPAIPEPTVLTGAGIAETTGAIEDDIPETPNTLDIDVAAPMAAQPSAVVPAAPQPVAPPSQPAPSRPKARAYPVQTPESPSFDSRMARFDRGVSNRSPQKLILYGIMIFIGGCVLAMILSATGASDNLAGLLFICAGPIGLIVLVIGIILAVARREGRQR